MSVRDTSKQAYSLIKTDTQCDKILKVVSQSKKPLTRNEIAKILRMEKSTTSARVNKLLQLTKLQEYGKRKDKYTHILSYTVWKVEQGRLF